MNWKKYKNNYNYDPKLTMWIPSMGKTEVMKGIPFPSLDIKNSHLLINTYVADDVVSWTSPNEDFWSPNGNYKSALVQCWGGGGPGKWSPGTASGGGGAFAGSVLSLPKNTSYTISGLPRAQAPNNADPVIFGDNLVSAAGGASGINGGAGGLATNSIGTTTHSGANGGAGGGGGAGSGGNASGVNPGTPDGGFGGFAAGSFQIWQTPGGGRLPFGSAASNLQAGGGKCMIQTYIKKTTGPRIRSFTFGSSTAATYLSGNAGDLIVYFVMNSNINISNYTLNASTTSNIVFKIYTRIATGNLSDIPNFSGVSAFVFQFRLRDCSFNTASFNGATSTISASFPTLTGTGLAFYFVAGRCSCIGTNRPIPATPTWGLPLVLTRFLYPSGGNSGVNVAIQYQFQSGSITPSNVSLEGFQGSGGFPVQDGVNWTTCGALFS